MKAGCPLPSAVGHPQVPPVPSHSLAQHRLPGAGIRLWSAVTVSHDQRLCDLQRKVMGTLVTARGAGESRWQGMCEYVKAREASAVSKWNTYGASGLSETASSD